MFFLFLETQKRFSRVLCAVCSPPRMDVISHAPQSLQRTYKFISYTSTENLTTSEGYKFVHLTCTLPRIPWKVQKSFFLKHVLSMSYGDRGYRTGLLLLLDLFLVSFSLIFPFVPCDGLSWLHVSFLLHVKCTISYRIVITRCAVAPALC